MGKSMIQTFYQIIGLKQYFGFYSFFAIFIGINERGKNSFLTVTEILIFVKIVIADFVKNTVFILKFKKLIFFSNKLKII